MAEEKKAGKKKKEPKPWEYGYVSPPKPKLPTGEEPPKKKPPKGPAESAGDVAEEITVRNRVLGALGSVLRGETPKGQTARKQGEALIPTRKKKKEKK